MKLSRNLNMTTGNPTSLLFTFAIPMLIGNLFQQAYSLADSIVVGHFVGANALAAVGSTGSTTFLFFSVCSGIASGSSVVTSQYFGAGDVRKTKSAIANSAYLMFAAALIMGLAAYIAAPSVLRLLGTPEEILPDAIAYIRISCLGVPLVAVYNYASSMLRALGDSRTPLFFLIIASVLNIILDVVLVYFFHMGVVGVGVATVIAQLVSGVSCILYALRHNPYFLLSKEDWRPDRKTMWHALKLGLPMAMQWSMIAVSTSVLQGFVNNFGPAAMAAYTATCRIDQLLQQPYGSVNAALSTYTGQNYGAKRMDRVKDGLRHGLMMCAVFTLVMMVIIQLFSRQIIGIFVSEQEVIAIGGTALRITSWFYIFLALIYMCRGVLNGVGDALFSFINGVVEVACRIFLPMALILIPTMGMWAIWWTTGATWMISGLTCLLRYAYWRHKAIKATEAEAAAEPART